MVSARLESIGTRTVNFDGSPTGSGKSFADIEPARQAGSSLTVLATHANCREVKATYNRHGLPASAYPELNVNSCPNYTEASQALEVGLSASAAVCLGCAYNADCEYKGSMADADLADHKIATHRRAQLSFSEITKGCLYVAIHEDPTDLLRPIAEVSDGLNKVVRVATAAGHAAWERRDQTQRHFFHRLERVAEWLIAKLNDVDSTEALRLPVAASLPPGVDRTLFLAMVKEKTYPPGNAVRICRGLAAGELVTVAIRVDRIFVRKGETTTRKAIIGIWQTRLPEKAATWFNDATADIQEIEAMACRPVIDQTPAGRIEQLHTTEQAPIDVKIGTSSNTVIKIIRGVLAAFPNAQRIGVITHKKHVPTIRGTAKKKPVLDERLQSRIVRVEHFRSGLSRGSNHWVSECDLIVVAGSPRVPPTAIRSRLIQRGWVAAAARDGEWERDYWSGLTTSGRRVTVRALAYRDRDWHLAHQSLVRSELLQAVGRGRAICPDGVPVIVLSGEDLGLPITEKVIEPIADEEIGILQAIARSPLGIASDNPGGNPPTYRKRSLNINTLGNTSDNDGGGGIATKGISGRVGKTARRVRQSLVKLEKIGLVERVGQRGGWRITAAGGSLLRPAPTPEELGGGPGGPAAIPEGSTT